MGIHLLPPLFKQVIEGGAKYGPETSNDFYPNPGEAGSACDGTLGRSGINETWAVKRAGAGNFSNDTLALLRIYTQSSASTGNWNALIRAIANFDTSTIPAGSKIVSAVLSLYCALISNTTSNTPAGGVVAATPANPGNMVASDYGQLGTTLLTNTIAFTSLVLNQYNDFTLLDAGLTAIKAAGITSLGIIESVYDRGGATPTWASLKQWDAEFNSADTAANKPKLHVHWQPPL